MKTKINLQETINKNNPFNSIIVEDKRKHPHDKIEVVCGKCGSIFKADFYALKASKYKICKKCTRETQGTKLKSFNEVVCKYEEKGYTPLFDTYTSFHTRMPVKDSEGYKGLVSLKGVSYNYKMRPFALDNPYALENLQHYSNLHNYNATILPQTYYGRDKKIKVQCKCGEKFVVDVEHFLNSNKGQCDKCSGSQSQYEIIIEKALQNYNLYYIRQMIFPECRNKSPLPFDFYVGNIGAIEVNGIGHYEPVRYNGCTKEVALKEYERTCKNDKTKIDFCKKNKIPLLIITSDQIENGSYKEILNQFCNLSVAT